MLKNNVTLLSMLIKDNIVLVLDIFEKKIIDMFLQQNQWDIIKNVIEISRYCLQWCGNHNHSDTQFM